MISKTCPCGNDFTIHDYRKDTAKYCSRSCTVKNRDNPLKGRKFPKGSLAKLRENNPMWGVTKVPRPGYAALHQWVKLRLDKPSACEHCWRNTSLDLANKSGNYTRDLSDWLWLCKQCHHVYDGRDECLNIGRELKKGLPLSKEHKKKLRDSHLGKEPWNKTNIYKNCSYCGVSFRVEPKANRKFCKRECYWDSLKKLG